MQGRHGNCSVGYMCVQSTMIEGTSVMQIELKGDLLSEAIFTGC